MTPAFWAIPVFRWCPWQRSKWCPPYFSPVLGHITTVLAVFFCLLGLPWADRFRVSSWICVLFLFFCVFFVLFAKGRWSQRQGKTKVNTGQIDGLWKHLKARPFFWIVSSSWVYQILTSRSGKPNKGRFASRFAKKGCSCELRGPAAIVFHIARYL